MNDNMSDTTDQVPDSPVRRRLPVIPEENNKELQRTEEDSPAPFEPNSPAPFEPGSVEYQRLYNPRNEFRPIQRTAPAPSSPKRPRYNDYDEEEDYDEEDLASELDILNDNIIDLRNKLEIEQTEAKLLQTEQELDSVKKELEEAMSKRIEAQNKLDALRVRKKQQEEIDKLNLKRKKEEDDRNARLQKEKDAQTARKQKLEFDRKEREQKLKYDRQEREQKLKYDRLTREQKEKDAKATREQKEKTAREQKEKDKEEVALKKMSYEESKEKVKEVEFEDPNEVIEIQNWIEKDSTLYFVMLVAGELSRTTEEMLHYNYKALIKNTNKEKISIKAKFSNELIAAWEKVMNRVMNVIRNPRQNREQLFNKFIESASFMQSFAEYTAFVISSKGVDVMSDYRSSKMINSYSEKKRRLEFNLMKSLQAMNQLNEFAVNKLNTFQRKRLLNFVR